MVRFITLVGYDGEIPADFADQQFPDPRCSGCPAGTTARATTRCCAQNLMTCTHYEPDFDALKAASTHLVIARGEESGSTLAARAADAIAARLGTTAVVFPSDHGGFLGGEYGQTGKPDEFATKLREVLAAQPVGV